MKERMFVKFVLTYRLREVNK